MSLTDQVLSEVEAFLQRAQMSASGFGKRVLNDEQFVFRLRKGGNVTARNIDKARDFIRDHDENQQAPSFDSTRRVAEPQPVPRLGHVCIKVNT